VRTAAVRRKELSGIAHIASSIKSGWRTLIELAWHWRIRLRQRAPIRPQLDVILDRQVQPLRNARWRGEAWNEHQAAALIVVVRKSRSLVLIASSTRASVCCASLARRSAIFTRCSIA
jgi:hypothetical protein